MDRFSSPCFRILPARSEVRACLEESGLGSVAGIELFAFSSANPAFQVDLAESGSEPARVVMRGEMQNDLENKSLALYSIEKEIYALRLFAARGVVVPAVLQDGRIFTVPGYDEQGKPAGDFRFFLMSYVPGIAVDRMIQALPAAERPGWFDRIAAIYARIHGVVGERYGVLDAHGATPEGHLGLADFLTDLFASRRANAARFISPDFADELLAFSRTVIPDLCTALAAAGYAPQRRLTHCDAAAGNLLVAGNMLNLLDLVLAGYHEPLTEFCPVVFCMREVLLGTVAAGTLWDFFLDCYRRHGGILPPPELVPGMLRLMMVNSLAESLLYCATHHSPAKRAKTQSLLAITRALIGIRSPDLAAIIGALN